MSKIRFAIPMLAIFLMISGTSTGFGLDKLQKSSKSCCSLPAKTTAVSSQTGTIAKSCCQTTAKTSETCAGCQSLSKNVCKNCCSNVTTISDKKPSGKKNNSCCSSCKDCLKPTGVKAKSNTLKAEGTVPVNITTKDKKSVSFEVLDKSLNPLKDHFNKNSNKKRILAILSPTWGGCVYAARAVLKEAIKNNNDKDLSVMIVWPKMLGGDDEKAARKTSKMFDDPRVHHFYDHNRLIGTKYAKTIFKNFGKDALTSLPKDHKISQLCGMLEQVAKNPPEKVPAWDVIFFYKSGSKWKETVPQPIGWSKQIAFLGATGDGEGHTGYFWANSFKNPLRKSDWYDEVRNQLKQLSKSSKK